MAQMASTLHFLVIYLSCSLLFSLSQSQTQTQTSSRSHGSHGSHRSQTSFKPNLLVLPVHHDAATGLPWAYVHKRTPLTQVPVLLDLNGNHMWVNCETHYSSSTYQAPFCHSTQCTRANSHTCHTCVDSASRPGCHNNTCGLMSSNPVTEQTAMGELAEDVLAIHATRGPRLGPMVSVPQFLFSCAPSFLVQKGLPNNVEGVVGLGHGPISLPNQLASHFGLQHQFTLCLPRYPTSSGAILFGDAPNNLLNTLDISRDLVYAPLKISPQGEYYVVISSLRINEHSVYPITPSSSSSSSSSSGSPSFPLGGVGGTLISTSYPYTVLHHTIFETFRQVFANQLPRQAQVNAVGPFGLCYDSKRINAVPSVELVMEERPEVIWRISGDNLMVQAQPGVSCLGIVDGGANPKAAIAIGARQLEENVVVFDLARSRLGFSNSLHSRGKSCGRLFAFANAEP